MAGKIKKILFATCGIIAALILALFANYSAFAAPVPASDNYPLTYTAATVVRNGPSGNTKGWFSGSILPYGVYIEQNDSVNYIYLQGVILTFNQTVPAGSFVDIPYSIFLSDGRYSAADAPALFSCGGACVLYENVLYNYYPSGSSFHPSSQYDNNGAYMAGFMRLYIPYNTNSVSLNASMLKFGVYLGNASYWTPSDAEKSIVDSMEQEQQEREEQKDKAESAGSDSESSSEDSQAAVDDASASLFDVLTKFVGAITGTSAGSCGISGDFGFFNAGTIDLCSGASKITPITTIVGTIMLLGLVIPGVLSLLHNFIDLFNEVTN